MALHRRGFLLVATCLGFTPRSGLAQGADASTPISVVRALFDAAAAGRWVQAAQYLNYLALDENRRQMLERFRHPEPVPTITPEEILRHDPDMPRAVAEYQAMQAEKQVRRTDWLSHEYANVHDTATLAGLSPLETAARWLEARDPRYQLRNVGEHSGCPEGFANATLADTASLVPRTVILGEVRRGDTAYVLHRNPEKTYQVMIGPSVATVVRRARAWRVEANEGLMGSVGMGMIISCESEPANLDTTRTKKPSE